MWLFQNFMYVDSHNTAVLMFHEQIAPAITSVPATSIARRFSTSFVSQEQGDEFKSLMRVLKEEKANQVSFVL